MKCSERFDAVLIQALIQLIFWYYAVKYIRSYVSNHCNNSKWFTQWSRKPDGFGGEFGAERIISTLGIYTQHWVGGILLILSFCLSSTQLFIMAALSEFAIEMLDTKEMIIGRWIKNEGIWSDKKTPTIWIIFMLMHHSGAFLTILPACIYYADNPYIHQITLGLLGYGAVFALIDAISSSRNIYDLQERGQFTVVSVLNFLSMIYFRWIIAVPALYWFLYQEWNDMLMIIKILTIIWIIVFKLFDCAFLMGAGHQAYAYVLGGKGAKKPSKITIASLKRAPSTPIQLIRMCSAPSLIN